MKHRLVQIDRRWWTSPAAKALSPDVVLTSRRPSPLIELAVPSTAVLSGSSTRTVRPRVTQTDSYEFLTAAHPYVSHVSYSSASCSRTALTTCGLVTVTPTSRSEVAVSTGNSSRAWLTLTPMPTTTPGVGPETTSARIPHTFRSSSAGSRTSLGHLRTARAPSDSTARATPRPVMSGIRPHSLMGRVGRSRTDRLIDAPCGLDHVRVSLPRPAVCSPATRAVQPGAPVRARSARLSLIHIS